MKCCFNNGKYCDILNVMNCHNCKSKCTTVEELKKRYEDIARYSGDRYNYGIRKEFELYRKRLEE